MAHATAELKKTLVIAASSTSEEVCQCLSDKGFPEDLVQVFREHSVDGEAFFSLRDDHSYVRLIPKFGHQLKFRKLYKELIGFDLPVPPVQVANGEVKYRSVSVQFDKSEMMSIKRELSLPHFNETLESHLREDVIDDETFRAVVKECAKFYKDTAWTQDDYAEIGKMMYETYPSIASVSPDKSGRYPWRHFLRFLSIKIRGIRAAERKAAMKRPSASDEEDAHLPSLEDGQAARSSSTYELRKRRKVRDWLKRDSSDDEEDEEPDDSPLVSKKSPTEDNDGIVQRLAHGFRTCLEYFAPPNFRLHKDAIHALKAEQLAAFPLQEFFSVYKLSLSDLLHQYELKSDERLQQAKMALASRLRNVDATLAPSLERESFEGLLNILLDKAPSL